MADTVKQSDIDKILKDNTDELSKLFKSIQTDAFNIFKDIATSAGGLTAGFKNAGAEIMKLKTPAEKYLGIQKLQETIQSKINELKSKTGYLDATALAFKGEEVKLQNAIIDAQINAAKTSNSLTGRQRDMLIDQLTIQKVKNEAELVYLNDLNGINGKQNEILEKLKLQSDALGEITPTLEKQENLWSDIKNIGTEFTSQFPILTMLIGKIWTAFNGIEDAAFVVRQNLGLIGDEGDSFKKTITDISVEFANIGVTSEIVGKSINGISNTFGNSAFASKEIVANFSALESSLGISSDTSSKVLKSLMGISQSSSKSQVSMIGFAQAFATAAGVPFTEVMKDLLTLSESVRTTFRGSTLQLVKSTVEARKLGLTITEAGNVAEKLLNFTESINAEIEASVMLGRNISFQDARTLAYKGDILGATKNILDTIEQTTDLNKLDALQLKSISEASGLTVGQLQDSLQLRKDLKQLQLSGNADARKQYDLYNQLNGLGKESAATAGEAALKRIEETNNLTMQKKLQAELNGLVLELGKAFIPAIQLLSKGLSVLTEINNKLRSSLGDWAAGIFTIGVVVTVLKSKWLSMFSSIVTKIPGVSKALNAIGMGSSAVGAAGASKSFGKGAMFAGFGSFLESLGTTATIMGAAASLYILAEALKNMPTDLGGLSIGEYMVEMAVGLGALAVAFAAMGLGFEVILPGAGVLAVMSGALVLFAGSMNQTALAVKVFADSFAKLTENLNVDNLSKIKDGTVAVKGAMSELRSELKNFSDKDLKVLENLGNLKANITTDVTKKKESDYVDLTNAIVTAIRTGMSNIQITVQSDGTTNRTFRNEITMVSRPGYAGVA